VRCDRIEIVRGPGSVLYGSNAISGVIQIFTRRRVGADFANVVASGGSYGARDYQLGGGFGKEAMAITLDASRSKTNGIYSFNNSASNDVYSGLIHFGSAGKAHLDIAGTAMGAPKTDINRSWGSGYGVRLLERLVAEYYEASK